MAIYQISRIEEDVRVMLDECREHAPLAGFNDAESLELQAMIRGRMCEAVRYVHTHAPYYRLESGKNFCDNICWHENETSGYTLLPLDFMRLVVFEMSDWERCVTTSHLMDSTVYSLQRNRYKGLRGNVQHPVCILGFRAEGQVLEFYSCKSQDATVVRAVYLPYPTVENGGIDISSQCYDAFLYYLSGLVLQSRNEAERAVVLFDHCKRALQ